MKRLVLVLAGLAALAGAGCAVSGGIATSTVTARDGDVEVVTRRVGGTVRCGPAGGADEAPCRTVSP
jgi:hypothetical protein